MRIYHLFYFTAVIAASLNLFGVFGMIIGCLIVAAWYYVYSGGGPSRRRNAFEVIVVAAILFVFSCCIIPTPAPARFAARRMQCANCVKQIALAMHNYESAWKKLPPAITYDAAGRSMHSWRVLLLPYLEEQRLYDQYSFDEAWDGPHNSKLLSKMPSVYRCPYQRESSESDYMSSYRVLVGERTCFPSNGSRAFSEIRDGLANTILIIESNQRVPWMEPSEPSLDEYIAVLKDWRPTKTPHSHSDLLTHYDSGGISSMADGTINHCLNPIDARLIEKLAYVDDGTLTEDELESLWNYGSVKRVRWEGYLAIGAFLFLAIFPAYWLFERRPPTARK